MKPLVFIDVRWHGGKWVVTERETSLILAERTWRPAAMEAARIACETVALLGGMAERVPWRKDGKLAKKGRDTYPRILDPEDSEG